MPPMNAARLSFSSSSKLRSLKILNLGFQRKTYPIWDSLGSAHAPFRAYIEPLSCFEEGQLNGTSTLWRFFEMATK